METASFDRDARLGGEARNAATAISPLDNISERILRVARNMQEITGQLNQHADAVHGQSPEVRSGDSKDEARDRASGALPRVHEALDVLDAALHNVADAAGRNCSLA